MQMRGAKLDGSTFRGFFPPKNVFSPQFSTARGCCVRGWRSQPPGVSRAGRTQRTRITASGSAPTKPGEAPPRLWAGDGGVSSQRRAGAAWLHLPGGEHHTGNHPHIASPLLSLPGPTAAGGGQAAALCEGVAARCATSGWRRRERHAQVGAGGRAGVPAVPGVPGGVPGRGWLLLWGPGAPRELSREGRG